ncbi:MAG TPA: excinuclease ABC subunit UvrA [candidate division Zixibacteria bacterium]|nr:excinuclease ABC subunit UvrA [candidate division Zixibacteria bacterium]
MTQPWGAIRIRGARENNLRNVSLDIPKRKLTVFTGVSGSGKSSLVFDTIAAESRRLINETYTAFIQGFMATPPRPDVDSLEGLTAAIIVDQEPMGANPRSTVGTATDAHAMLRILFSRLGQPHVGPASAFSFNMPAGTLLGEVDLLRGARGEHEERELRLAGGMCAECEGLGRISTVDVDALVDRDRSLNEGAITFPNFQPGTWYHRVFLESGFFDPDKKLRDYTDAEWERFLYGPDQKVNSKGLNINITYVGLVDRIRRLYLVKDPESLRPHLRAAVERAATFTACPACDGTRLNALARSSLVNGRSIADCAAMQITDLLAFVQAIDAPQVAPILEQLTAVLGHFVEIGLGYLSLDRATSTLSGGESQRTRMVRHLGSSLTDVTYVFDEPTVGLHPHDVERMNRILERLRDKGNTVLVVEHEPDVIRIADHVVDLGPGAGTHGGEIVYQGSYEGLRASGTLTGRHLEVRQTLKERVRQPQGSIPIRNARLHNLQDVSVDVPLGVLVAVTGVAGSGKSSLIHGCMPRHDPPVTLIDQSVIRGSRRSNPATYTGILDPIRKAFASANGVKPALFSANSEGACPECRGLGLIYTDLAFMAGVVSVCEVCEGRRFSDEVLGYRLRGRNVAEVLDMSVEEAGAFFTEERAVRVMLDRLSDVGLGYITLGQMLYTLSGGERQRLKLAIEMSGDAQVYVLDEPTSGLHMNDVDNLIGLLDRLVESGRTVIVVEHNLDVVARADWVIDLGPGAGHEGGRIVFEGPPGELVNAPGSLTGEHLRRRVPAAEVA